MRRADLLLLLGLLAATAAGAAHPPKDWRRIVSQKDKTKLKLWRATWVTAADQARARGFGAKLDAAGPLLNPDAGLEHPELPDGAYRCRTIRVGMQGLVPSSPNAPALFEAPAGNCRVGDHMLVRLDGVQRPGGRLYPYDAGKLLLVGGLAIGDEPGLVRYGRDPRRALVGYVERIGPQRWRLVLPEPAWEARLEVMELVPASS